jgi:hypothetical protein
MNVVCGFCVAIAADFENEIQPLLTRYGCNSGGCHGKASGQNGFKLSLFGFDSQADYEEIVDRARGRRVNVATPEQSLLLLKSIGAVPHGGGTRFAPTSQAYEVLRQWISDGVPPASPTAPRLLAIRIEPSDRSLGSGDQVNLRVMASYSDQQERDVTKHSAFASNLDVVASVSEEGVVTAGKESGEATVMARFMGQVAVFTAILPHGIPLAQIDNFPARNYIDELTIAKWKKLGLTPTPVCDDSTFIRRVTLDANGRLPTAKEVREFLADQNPNKRAEWIDRLLDAPEYASYFALRWGSVLRNSNLAGADQASYAFHNWLKDMLARNRPYDEFVRGIIAASGEWQDAPAINWYWQSRDDQLHQVTADTAQVFLGQRLQCARCHHHPYEKWSQDDYYGLAGFFTRLGRKSFGQPPPYFASPTATTGEKNPRTGKVPDPRYLSGEAAVFSAEEDPRHGLVDWMAKPENPFFAKSLVNRLWGHFFGRGLVHEVDDMRATNPASNPQLLDALAKDFIDHQFDMQHICRVMLNSSVYQLGSEPTEGNQKDRQNFARYYGRRMIAEVFLDSIDQATGTKTKFNGVASSSRAVDLPHENFGSHFLDTFDRPRRVTGCECERSSGATLAQVLTLANSDEIESKIGDAQGVITRLLKDQRSFDEIVDELYLGSLSRFPTSDERIKTKYFVDAVENKTEAYQDLLWTLLNSREFMFNH